MNEKQQKWLDWGIKVAIVAILAWLASKGIKIDLPPFPVSEPAVVVIEHAPGTPAPKVRVVKPEK